MKKKISSVKFTGTKEQKSRLLEAIRKYKNSDGPLVMILHASQEIYGYLPYEVMEIISRELDISINEVYSVASFYTQFRLNKSGKYQIGVCMGTACYIKGSDKIVEEIKNILGIGDGECTVDGKFSLDTTRCLGCCGMAPVLAINDEIHGNVKVSDIKKILDSYE